MMNKEEQQEDWLKSKQMSANHLSFYIDVQYKSYGGLFVCYLATILLKEAYFSVEELFSMNKSLHFSFLCLYLMNLWQVYVGGLTVGEKQ